MTKQIKNKLAVILPAYNEELTIQQTIESFWNVIPDSQIIIVNNNSKDKTAEIAQNTLKALNADGRVLNEMRQGKANAVRRAFLDIEADIYVLADADLTYPAEMIFDLIQPIVDGNADMVVGDRLIDGHYAQENKRQFHNFGNKLVKSLINYLFNSNISDVMSGYRVLSRKFVKNYPILVEGFELETDMTLHALDKRLRILEISVPYKDRPLGSFSKLSTFTDGAKVIFTIAQILRYYRPLAFFGTVSIFLSLVGIFTAVPVFKDWIVHRYIYHVPLAVLSCGLEIVAIMSLGIGLILDSNAHQHRMNSERNFLEDR